MKQRRLRSNRPNSAISGCFRSRPIIGTGLPNRSVGRRKQVKVLNLFAHTGAATFAAAQVAAEVTHVDSARNTVAWARRNAFAGTRTLCRPLRGPALQFLNRSGRLN
jgi:16S rRNA G966 N2-methylase RsmD